MFNVGPGGWLLDSPSVRARSGSTYVRLWRDAARQLAPAGNRRAFRGCSPETLRRIPFRRILLAVAASESLRDKLAARL